MLTEQQELAVRDLIDSGAYGSASEVVGAALKLLEMPVAIGELEEKLLEGIGSPREALRADDFEGIRDRIRTQFGS